MKKYLLRSSYVLLFGSSVLGFNSCQSLDGIRDRLDKLEISVSDLKAAVSALQDAYRDGKVIKSITPITDVEAGGWLLTFSDMSEIKIVNGIDGITPYMKIDKDGYWSVSYDNGQTFTAILDANGNKINAVGIDGKNGADGIALQVVLNENGNYVVQSYRESNPETIISELITPYSGQASQVISSMSQDDMKHTMTIRMADGSEFSFAQHYEFPTSISIMVNAPITLRKGGQASVDFRVSPSNAFLGNADECLIELDYVGTISTRSYVTKPTYYSLQKVEQVYDANTGELRTGQYRATIVDNKTGKSYDESVAIVLTLKDTEGKSFQLSSNSFEVQSSL